MSAHSDLFFLFQVFEENAIFHDISKFEEFLIIQFKNILNESLLITVIGLSGVQIGL